MSAWLAYICAVQGHVVTGIGNGTAPSSIVWATYCSRCGASIGSQGQGE
jgi:hypothetical protein